MFIVDCRIAGLLVVCSAFVVTPKAMGAEDQKENLIRRVQTEVPVAWKAALEQSTRLRAEIKWKEIDRLDGGSTAMSFSARSYAADQHHLETIELDSPTKQYEGLSKVEKSGVFGWNSKYRFELHRAVGASEWVVKQITFRRPEGGDDGLDSLRKSRRALYHFGFGGGPLADFLTREGSKFVCVSATHTPDGFIRAVFEQNHPEVGSSTTIKAVLDPASHWCVREVEGISSSPEWRFTDSGTFSYVRQPNGFPLPTLVKTTESAWKGKTRMYDIEKAIEFKCDLNGGVAEHECSLSAFGLSEPVGAEVPRPRAYFWFFAAGGACLVLSLFVGWLYRRRTAPDLVEAGR